MQTMRDGECERFRSLFVFSRKKNQDSSFNIVGEEKLKKMQKMMKDLLLTFFLSLFLIYALLAAQFESLLFPFPCHGKYSICFGRCDSWFS